MEDKLKKIIDFFTHSTHSHVAVVEQGKLLGLLGEADLDSFDPKLKVEDYHYQLENFSIFDTASWLDVLEVFTRNEANILPVLDKDEQLVGYYDLSDIVGIFTDMPFFTEPGAILVIAKAINDYSFSEISQIVESNNTRLLGAFITEIRNEVVQITLKMGESNINEVIQTFRRYHYSILFGSVDDHFLEGLKQRSDYLDKYLNV